MRRSTTMLAVATGALLLASTPAAAKVFTPTGFGDPSPGACKLHDRSLREAISAANARPGADEVVLKAGKTYTLSIPGRLDEANATGDLDVLARP